MMTSSERVLTALQHKEPDRVPLDLGGSFVTGITAEAYSNLIDYLGLDTQEVVISEMTHQLAQVDESLLEKFQVDTRGLAPQFPSGWTFAGEEDDRYRYFTDEWGIVWRMPKKNGLYYDMYRHPLADITSQSDLDGFAWPDPEDPVRLKGLKEKAKHLTNEKQVCVVFDHMSAGFFELGGWLRGYANWFMDLAGNPKLAERILDITLDIRMRFLDKALDELKGDIMVLIEYEDLGSQKGPLISPAMYRKFVKPRQKKLYSFIKKKAPVYIFLHSCGSIYELIPDIIETGVDILNPLQFNTPNMDTLKLKKEFGDVLTFWGGGIDTQQTLPKGNTMQVRDEVKRQIDILSPGGGFVFSTVHNIQPDVPPENIVAMMEAFLDYR